MENISIHVPREGHDAHFRQPSLCGSHFNPRAPRGARQDSGGNSGGFFGFQSTCPARGTTRALACAP